MWCHVIAIVCKVTPERRATRLFAAAGFRVCGGTENEGTRNSGVRVKQLVKRRGWISVAHHMLSSCGVFIILIQDMFLLRSFLVSFVVGGFRV